MSDYDVGVRTRRDPRVLRPNILEGESYNSGTSASCIAVQPLEHCHRLSAMGTAVSNMRLERLGVIPSHYAVEF